MNRDFTLAPPNDLAGGQQLGFYAKTLLVSNPTPAWWYLPDQLTTIAPYALGMVIPLLGTESAKIVYQAPVGISQPTTIATGTATFRYTDQSYAPQQGLAAYGLVPPGANSDYITLLQGATLTYNLKGPSNKVSIVLFNTTLNNGGLLTIQPRIAVAGGGLLTFEVYNISIGFRSAGPLTPIQIDLPFSLPATASIIMSHNVAATLSGVILY